MSDNLLENLNPAQTEAVVHDFGPLMIVAGAGTGKTTVITHRIAYLIEQGKAKPEEILALTFTDKAAQEMEERVDRLVPMGYLDLWISTFHSFCERVLKAHALEIGIPDNFRLLNQTDAWLLVRKNFDRFKLDYFRPAGNPTRFIHALLQHFSRAKDEHVTPDDYLNFVENLKADQDTTNSSDEEKTNEVRRLDEIANAYHEYQKLLLENEALDFGDLIFYTLQLFQRRPKILAEYQKQFKYVLVDEFQDTNWAQYELVKLLSAPKNNLTVVGDDDQSIYKFRGAALSNILQFSSDFPEAKKIVLTENYRSGQKILDQAYQFISLNNPNRLEVQLEKGLTKKLVSRASHDGDVEHIHCSTIDEEAQVVINRIKTLAESGVAWQQIAILLRANDSAEPFIAELEKQNIPYQYLALKGLYVKPVIIDALAYLRVVDHPYHSPSWYRILSHPTLGINSNDLAKISHEAYKQGRSLFQIIEKVQTISSIDQETLSTVSNLLSLTASLRDQARRKNISELYVEMIKQSGILGFVNTLPERIRQEEFRFLQQFYERMKSFEKLTDDKSLHRFLEELEHEQNSGDEGALKADPEEGFEAVRIMTVHGSKGLEFEHVFIGSVVDRRFPTSEKKDAIPLPDALIKETLPIGDAHLEEERRLMYVALTRAKKAVYLSSAEDYGGARKKKLSRFLIEMGFEPKATNGFIQEFTNQIVEKEDHKQDAFINIPKAFSFTQLAAFSTCPLQYKFAHILHVPVFGRQTLSFGKTMHATMQKFFELWIQRQNSEQKSLFDYSTEINKTDDLPVSEKELLEIYDSCWIDEWYESDVERENYRKKGKVACQTAYTQMGSRRPKPIYLEKGFTLKFGDIIVRGRIDRVDVLDDGVEIIDYKTGKPKCESDLNAEDKRQLMLYQLAAHECFDPPLKVNKLTYYYLEDNSQVSFLGTPEELNKLSESIIETAEAIRKSDFSPTPGFLCQFCDFKDICEFRK